MIIAGVSFREKIYILIKRRKLTQAKIASEIEISPGYLGKICAGYISPDRIPDELKDRIAKALDVSKTVLFEDMGIAFKQYDKSIKEFRKSFRGIDSMIKRASAEIKKMIPPNHLTKIKRIQKEWKRNRKYVR